MNFVKILKSRIEKENSKSAAELYKEEQSKLIEELGDMELVAKSLPQLVEMTETYVNPDQALFPIELWNQYDDNDNKRSNNDIEGYNLWLSLWLHKHPNIWKFI